MTPKFKLLKKGSTTPTQIRLFIYHADFKAGRFVWGTGKSILPALWDFGTERPTKKKTIIARHEKENRFLRDELRTIRTRIDATEAEAKQYQLLCDNQGKRMDADELRQNLESKIKGERKADEESVLQPVQYIKQIIAEMHDGTRKIDNERPFAKNTIRKYESFLNVFLDFQAQYGPVTWENIDLDFYDAFVEYLYSRPGRKKKGVVLTTKKGKRVQSGEAGTTAKNTVGKAIGTLKAIMSYAKDDGHHNSDAHKGKRFKRIKETVDNDIYIFPEELEVLKGLHLEDEYQARCRDMFVIGCLTAQRYSDYHRINTGMIEVEQSGNKTINLVQAKTDVPVKIPVHPWVLLTLEKYGGSLPYVSEPGLNRTVKEIGKLAGINRIETVHRTTGAGRTTFTGPKYEFLETHTARRTGATLMYLAGIPELDICKITGHTTIKALMDYLKIDKEQTAKRLAKSDFFKATLKIAK